GPAARPRHRAQAAAGGDRDMTAPPPPRSGFGPSTLREPQSRPEPGRGTTGSGPSRATSRDGEVSPERAAATGRAKADLSVIFEEVSKFYGEVLGVNRVTLNIPPGITSLVGP